VARSQSQAETLIQNCLGTALIGNFPLHYVINALRKFNNMTTSQQRLHSLHITKLKSIKGLDISFEPKNVTAILGPNGCGKSTILHALACCFHPPNDKEEEYYKFSNFFLPSPDALWEGSELKVCHTYRQESHLYEKEYQPYGKSSDRWKPIYKRRPTRNIHYLGIDTYVPLIETEKRRNVKINYTTSNISEDIVISILKQASYCLNRKYDAYNIHDTGKGREFIGVEANGIRYSALSMSAGEQKIFFLLERIYRAKKYSLILIDELDLLLHESALKKLIEVISKRADEKHLQVVFTTHRETVPELSNLINIRHIFNTPEKTLCLDETKPDAINRLTGSKLRPIEIFVEDDLAAAIVKKIAGQLGIARHVSIQRYGSAINCFTILAGLCLRGEPIENSIFVLDGDAYRNTEDQEARLAAILTGNDSHAQSLRKSSIGKIKCLKLPENSQPEKYIHSIIVDLEPIDDNEEYREIIEAARQITTVDDNHRYVSDIIDRLGWDRSVGLSKIIDLASLTNEWTNYIADVKDWLTLKIPLVQEPIRQVTKLHLNSRIQSRLGITPEQLAEFCQQWYVSELALFGSVLCDDFSSNSDIDVLVSYHPTAKRGLLEKIRMQEELSSLLHRDVDLVSKKAIEQSHNWLRRRNILDSAEVIYVA
jgi:predicted nucleotidyltransferase/ABC-type lipoprotein export system ATPase subunit